MRAGPELEPTRCWDRRWGRAHLYAVGHLLHPQPIRSRPGLRVGQGQQQAGGYYSPGPMSRVRAKLVVLHTLLMLGAMIFVFVGAHQDSQAVYLRLCSDVTWGGSSQGTAGRMASRHGGEDDNDLNLLSS